MLAQTRRSQSPSNKENGVCGIESARSNDSSRIAVSFMRRSFVALAHDRPQSPELLPAHFFLQLRDGSGCDEALKAGVAARCAFVIDFSARRWDFPLLAGKTKAE